MRFMLITLGALVLTGCAFGSSAKWPWRGDAREVIVRDFNDDEIVEPCLTMEEKVKRLRALLCEDCEDDGLAKPVTIDVPLEIGVTPTISPTSAARTAEPVEGYPRVVRQVVTTYEGGLPETTVVTPE